jgi:hypothetical protein
VERYLSFIGEIKMPKSALEKQKDAETNSEPDLPKTYSNPGTETEAKTYTTEKNTEPQIQVVPVDQVSEIMKLELGRWMQTIHKIASSMFDGTVVDLLMEKIQAEIVGGTK